jgi:hypothetical protein
MSRAGPYAKSTRAEREDILATLMEEWTKNWEDGFGKRADGSMVWQVNAVDVMLLVNEIERLRRSSSER